MPHNEVSMEPMRSTIGTQISETTKRDIEMIRTALADKNKRRLAEAALSVVATILEKDRSREPPPKRLSREQRKALASIGIGEEEMPLSEFVASTPVVEGVRLQARVIAEAIPISAAARRIGVSDRRLRQRISEGTLVAVRRPRSRGWLIPAFQLTDTGEVPHIGQVLRSMVRDLSAESLDRLFNLPNDNLGGATPRDWLISGEDPLPVMRLVSGL